MATNVPAVESSIRILELLARNWPQGVPSREVVRELNLNRSTCYNILSTLQQSGWVRTSNDRTGWALGPRLLTLTGVTDDVALVAMQREIDNLSRRIGYVVFVVEVEASRNYVVIAKAEQRLGVRVTVGTGQRFEFSSPALMNAAYAWAVPEDFEKIADRKGIKAFTPHTITDRDELRAELESTRQRGFSISLQQFDLSQSGAAAPLIDGQGRVSHVVCTLAFSSELTQYNVEHTGKLLLECANKIAEMTGGRVLGS